MSDPIRLLQVTHDLAIGGLQQVVVSLCETINREKFELSVLCLRARGELADTVERLGIPVHVLPQKPVGTDYFSFLKIAEVIKSTGAQVLHTHNTQAFIEGVLAGKLAGVSHMVHTDHGRQWPDKRRYMWAERVASHYVHKVVGVSEHTSQCLVRYERLPRSKVITIPNGVHGARYHRPIDAAAMRARLSLPVSGTVLGLGCRLVEGKGITYLIQAMGLLRDRYPSLRLLLAGEGPHEAQLRQEVQALNLESEVVFLGPRLDMPELLGVFDIYVLPSLSEGLPMALLEAMAAGCAIIASNVGGIPGCIRNDVNGVLVPPGDAAALADAIAQQLDDPQRRVRYGNAARQHFERDFSAATMAARYEKLYQGLSIESPAGRAQPAV